jgi:hypothetical protein
MSALFRAIETLEAHISGRFGPRIILSARTHADFVVNEGFILKP